MPEVGETIRSESKRTLKDRLGYDPEGQHPLYMAVRLRFPPDDERDSTQALIEVRDEVFAQLGVERVQMTSASYRSRDNKVLSTHDVEVSRHQKKSGKSLLQRVLNSDENYPLVLNVDVVFDEEDERLAKQAADELRSLMLDELGVESVTFIKVWYHVEHGFSYRLVHAYDYESLRFGKDVERVETLGD